MASVLRVGLLAVLLLLSACGGGGGGDTPTPASKYKVGGTITGLTGTGLVLQLNGGSDLQQQAAGAFEFQPELTTGTAYTVSVKSQPNGPAQTCVVSNGSGSISHTTVIDIVITCSTNTYKVGGSVTGLKGSGLTLLFGDGTSLRIGADGPFQAPQIALSGTTYSVTLAAQPTGPDQNCSIANGSGTIAGSDITNVQVSCAVIPISSAVLNMTAVDEVWDAHAQRLYVSAKGGSPAILVVNPQSGQVERSVATPALATTLAISGDYQYLYAAIVTSGNGAIARYRLPDFTPDTSTVLSQGAVPYGALNIAVQPGRPGTIAVLAERLDSTMGRYRAVFDDGIQRGGIIGGDQTTSGVFWNPGGDELFLFNGIGVAAGVAQTYSSIGLYTVNASGFSSSTSFAYPGLVRAPFGAVGSNPAQMVAYRLYTTSGVVYDTDLHLVVGAFRTAGQSEAIDLDVNKAFFASADSSGGRIVFETFNLTRMTLIERETVTATAGSVQKLIRWGQNGLAAITDNNQLVLASGGFVSEVASNTIRTDDAVSLQDDVSTAGQYQIRSLALPARVVAWNATQNLLYAAVNGSNSKYGNSVSEIDTASSKVLRAAAIGSEPSQMVLSDDSQKLYLSYDDSSEVTRVSTSTMSKDFDLVLLGGDISQSSVNDTPLFPTQIAVASGQSSTIALAAGNSALPYATRVLIADDAVVRPSVFKYSPPTVTGVAWGPSTTLYANNDQGHLFTLQTSSSGVSFVSDYPFFPGGPSLYSVGGYLYSNYGIAFDPSSKDTLVFQGSGPWGGSSSTDPLLGPVLFVDPSRNRAYMAGVAPLSTTTRLEVYNLSARTLLDTIPLPQSDGFPLSIVTTSANTIAVAMSGDHLLLISGSTL
jgi:hypothetical protein